MELTNELIAHPFPRSGLLARAKIEAAGGDGVVVRLPGATRARTEF